MAKTKNKIKLAITNVDKSAASITLEGEHSFIKYIVLMDYDLASDTVDNHMLGDQYDMELVLTHAASRPPKNGQVAVPGSGICPGSGKIGATYTKWPTHGTMQHSATCPDCGKRIGLNSPKYRSGGYASPFRKHKGVPQASLAQATTPTPAVTGSGACPGSGTVPTTPIIGRAHKYGNDKAVCPHCGKTRMVKYDGTFGKHKT